LIPNSKLDPFAVGICDRMDDSADTLNCMETVQDGTYDNHAALAVCELIPNPAQATTCLDEVADEDFQDNAVRACYHVGDGKKMIECVKAVADKTYTQSEVVQCDQWPFGDGTIKCFNERGEDHSIDYSDTSWLHSKKKPCKQETPMEAFINKMEAFQRSLKQIPVDEFIKQSKSNK